MAGSNARIRGRADPCLVGRTALVTNPPAAASRVSR